MSTDILILVATESGTAEMVADEVADRLEDAGFRCKISLMNKVSVEAIKDAQTAIICSSTHGTGDIPANGLTLFQALEAERPDLSGIRFGVIALGDSVYSQTFCFGGRKFDELLGSLGGQRIGPRVEHDRRGADFPEDLAGDWVERWIVNAQS